jgi:hypothetical protein
MAIVMTYGHTWPEVIIRLERALAPVARAADRFARQLERLRRDLREEIEAFARAATEHAEMMREAFALARPRRWWLGSGLIVHRDVKPGNVRPSLTLARSALGARGSARARRWRRWGRHAEENPRAGP